MDELIVEDLLLPNGVEFNDMVLVQNEFGRGVNNCSNYRWNL